MTILLCMVLMVSCSKVMRLTRWHLCKYRRKSTSRPIHTNERVRLGNRLVVHSYGPIINSFWRPQMRTSVEYQDRCQRVKKMMARLLVCIRVVIIDEWYDAAMLLMFWYTSWRTCRHLTSPSVKWASLSYPIIQPLQVSNYWFHFTDLILCDWLSLFSLYS